MASRPTRAIAAAWLVAAALGLAAMASYQNTAGHSGRTPTQWPAPTSLALAAERATLVMFVHPRCPCSRASLEELNRLLTKCRERVAVQVYFFQPAGVAADWSQTQLWRTARAIPGVTVHADADGAEARRFGAETSGFVVLYNTRGELLFHGGITGGRGHVGDNLGANSLVATLASPGISTKTAPVYGCSLWNGCQNSGEVLCQP